MSLPGRLKRTNLSTLPAITCPILIPWLDAALAYFLYLVNHYCARSCGWDCGQILHSLRAHCMEYFLTGCVLDICGYGVEEWDNTAYASLHDPVHQCHGCTNHKTSLCFSMLPPVGSMAYCIFYTILHLPQLGRRTSPGSGHQSYLLGTFQDRGKSKPCKGASLVKCLG